MTLIKEVNCMVLAFFDLCCYVRFYKGNLPIISVRHHSYDPDGKTTVELLNKNLEVLMIDSYSQVTAYFNHIEHLYHDIPIKFVNKVSCVMQLMDICVQEKFVYKFRKFHPWCINKFFFSHSEFVILVDNYH